MEVKPNYCKLSVAFSEGTVFEVPKYQRAYSWTKNNVEQFCDDMLQLYESNNNDVSREHFLGGIVCVKVESENDLDERNVFQLVDGQQRLSTIVLFFSRLIFKMKALSLDESTSILRERRVGEYNDKFVELAVEENEKIVRIPRITLSKRDYNFYNNLICNGDSIDVETKSHQLLVDAKDVIDLYIDKVSCSSDEKENLSSLKKLYQVVSVCCKILLIKMSDVSDAYRLFQVINDRGRALTPGDLLRASSLGDLDMSGLVVSERLDELIDKWDEITKAGVKSTDDRLMQYYTAMSGRKIRRTVLFETFNQYFFSKTEEIENQIVLLSKAVQKLHELDRGEWPYENSNISQYQRNKLKSLVVNLKHKHCLPFIFSATQLSEKKFYQIIFFLEKFFFIYKVALDRRIDPVSKIYYDHIKKINKSPGTYQVREFINELKDLLQQRVTKSDVSTFLDDLCYQENGDNRTIKFILSSVEESYSWIRSSYRRGALGLYAKHTKSLSPDVALISIEHIYPRNALEQDRDEELEKIKNNIGNLTLLYTQENSEAMNATIKHKRELYSKSRLNITSSLDRYEFWRAEHCNKRRDSLLEWVIAVFTFSIDIKD